MPKRRTAKQPTSRQPLAEGRGWGAAVRIAAVLAALAAVYGAALSTVVYRSQREENALRRAEKARRLDVTLSFAPTRAGGEQFPPGLQLSAANPGDQPVVLATGGVFLPSGQPVYMDVNTKGWQYPQSVAPGDNVMTYLNGDSLARLCDLLVSRGFDGTVTLVGFYGDALGGLHPSKPLRFDIQKARTLVPLGSRSPSPPGTNP